MELQILFEDAHVLVCNKPAGIPTQTSKVGSQDMVSILKNYLYRKQKEKKEPYVAVIHRLDQPVEGILVFAKTPFAAKGLNSQMQSVGFGKYYKAVVCGTLEEKSGKLEHYMVKDARLNLSSICEPSVKDAKRAVLFYEVENEAVEDGEARSLLNIKLETGRHHQIRAQMAAMGCPIWGDAKYNEKQADRRNQIALCAYRLEFLHPKTNKKMIFERKPEGAGFREMFGEQYIGAVLKC